MAKKRENQPRDGTVSLTVYQLLIKQPGCYNLKPLELGERTTLVLSNTRELDRELFYKLVYLI